VVRKKSKCGFRSGVCEGGRGSRRGMVFRNGAGLRWIA
jgi:hypothetical protein